MISQYMHGRRTLGAILLFAASAFAFAWLLNEAYHTLTETRPHEVSINDFGPSSTDYHWLSVRDCFPLTRAAVQKATEPRNGKSVYEIWVPLVRRGWRAEEPIRAVAYFKDATREGVITSANRAFSATRPLCTITGTRQPFASPEKRLPELKIADYAVVLNVGREPTPIMFCLGVAGAMIVLMYLSGQWLWNVCTGGVGPARDD